MKIIPLGARLEIELHEKVSKSGIVLPNQELDSIATVISVGIDVKQIEKGDKVIFNKFAGYTLENPMRRLIEEKDVLAIVKD